MFVHHGPNLKTPWVILFVDRAISSFNLVRLHILSVPCEGGKCVSYYEDMYRRRAREPAIALEEFFFDPDTEQFLKAVTSAEAHCSDCLVLQHEPSEFP